MSSRVSRNAASAMMSSLNANSVKASNAVQAAEEFASEIDMQRKNVDAASGANTDADAKDGSSTQMSESSKTDISSQSKQSESATHAQSKAQDDQATSENDEAGEVKSEDIVAPAPMVSQPVEDVNALDYNQLIESLDINLDESIALNAKELLDDIDQEIGDQLSEIDAMDGMSTTQDNMEESLNDLSDQLDQSSEAENQTTVLEEDLLVADGYELLENSKLGDADLESEDLKQLDVTAKIVTHDTGKQASTDIVQSQNSVDVKQYENHDLKITDLLNSGKINLDASDHLKTMSQRVAGQPGVNASENSVIARTQQTLELWAAKLNPNVKLQLTASNNEMTIRLHPPALGELKIAIRTEGAEVHIRMSVDNDAAKRIVESNLMDLKDDLNHDNLNLAGAQVDINQNKDNSDEWEEAAEEFIPGLTMLGNKKRAVNVNSIKNVIQSNHMLDIKI